MLDRESKLQELIDREEQRMQAHIIRRQHRLDARAERKRLARIARLKARMGIPVIDTTTGHSWPTLNDAAEAIGCGITTLRKSLLSGTPVAGRDRKCHYLRAAHEVSGLLSGGVA